MGSASRSRRRERRAPAVKKPVSWTVWLALVTALGAAPQASEAKDKVYVLSGYTYSGFPGVDTDEFTAKMKDRPGARITRTDIAADEALMVAELKTRNLKGRLFTSLAEKHGKVWIIFDLMDPHPELAHFKKPLKSQAFEGAAPIAIGNLTAATGLKVGDTLSFDKIKAARQGLLDLYARVTPGKTPTIRSRLQSTGDGHVILTWMIGAP